MNIPQSNYEEILTELKLLREQGYNFITYMEDSPVVYSCSDVESFRTGHQAAEYCYESSTDMDTVKSLSIPALCVAMEKALHVFRERPEVDEVIDLGLLLQMSRQNEKQINNLNESVMNEKNFEYLRDQVKLTGFGESLEYELKEKMKQQADKFDINFAKDYGKNKVEATLNFKKSEQGDMYFFNTYDVKLNKDNPETAKQQSFFINNNKSTITMKEAYNLLDGRSVFKDLKTKEGQDYSAWVKLDFKQTDDKGNFKQVQFGERYGYDLEAELKKHPIKELSNDAYKGELIGSLKKGNVQSATFVKDGQEVRQYVEANPQYKNINLYDANMQRLDSRRSQSENQSEGQGQKAKEAAKKGQAAEDGAGAQKDKKKRGQHI